MLIYITGSRRSGRSTFAQIVAEHLTDAEIIDDWDYKKTHEQQINPGVKHHILVALHPDWHLVGKKTLPAPKIQVNTVVGPNYYRLLEELIDSALMANTSSVGVYFNPDAKEESWHLN